MTKIEVSNFFFTNSNVEYILSIDYRGTHFKSTFRYSQLKLLHDKLCHYKLQPPQFPSKSFFGKTNGSVYKIQQRKRQLDEYFKTICSLPEIINSVIFGEFLDIAIKNQLEIENRSQINLFVV